MIKNEYSDIKEFQKEFESVVTFKQMIVLNSIWDEIVAEDIQTPSIMLNDNPHGIVLFWDKKVEHKTNPTNMHLEIHIHKNGLIDWSSQGLHLQLPQRRFSTCQYKLEDALSIMIDNAKYFIDDTKFEECSEPTKVEENTPDDERDPFDTSTHDPFNPEKLGYNMRKIIFEAVWSGLNTHMIRILKQSRQTELDSRSVENARDFKVVAQLTMLIDDYHKTDKGGGNPNWLNNLDSFISEHESEWY